MVKTPVRSIVGAIARAAARWSDGRFSPRQRARDAVCSRTGYAPAAVDYAFDRLFGSLRRDTIESVIADELGSVDVLDDFVGRPGRPPSRALPVGRVCVIASRTTIGVAVVPAIFALCAKCSVLIKDREDALGAAFFSSLGDELHALRDNARAERWDSAAQADRLRGFDAVVAFGRDDTLREITASLAPGTRFIPYGSKASAGYVARESLFDEFSASAIAADAARDLILYESEGCLSLHALFVERGAAVTPQHFGELLSQAIAELTMEFPEALLDAVTAAKVAAARDLTVFRAGGGGGALAGQRTSFLVTVDPPAEEPPLFLPRVIGVRSVDVPGDALAFLRHHGIALEALAVAPPRDDLTQLAIDAGASRLAAFGRLQSPPLGAFHGGRPRISEFVRWIGNET
jgi:Acyl-CoA reductase (LuxC)